MTFEELVATLADASPPDAAPLVVALWHDRRGAWEQAHRIAQDLDGRDAEWVHAYLHRKEGDLSNARYWYRRANVPEANDSLDAEWKRLVTTLLAH